MSRRQLGGGVEVGEGGERRRVGVVVGGHVHGLQRGDRAAPGRGDALLQLAHLVGQGGLVAHGRGHAAEQRRHLGAGLHEAEDVVDEQQHVLALARRGSTRPSVSADRATRRRTPGGSSIWPKTRAAFSSTPDSLHLDEEVGALTGALAHAGEHRHAAVLLGDPADHLGDEHGLAHAGAAEQADLAALQVGREQVDDLDAGLEHAPSWARACRSPAPGGGSPSGPRSSTRRASATSSGSPITLNTWPSTPSPTGIVRPSPEVAHRRRRGAGRRSASGRWPAPGCRRSAGRPRPAPRSSSPLDRDGHLERGVDLGQGVGRGTRRRRPGRRWRRPGRPSGRRCSSGLVSVTVMPVAPRVRCQRAVRGGRAGRRPT